MAIIPQIPGLSVTVKVAGETATEYAPPSEEDEGGPTTGLPTTRCYIESTSGVTFSIEAQIAPEFDRAAPNTMVVFGVYIDDKRVRGPIIKFEHLGRRWPYVYEIRNSCTEAATPGYAVEQFFEFATISPVEDAVKARITLDTESAKSLGIIRVHVALGHGSKRSKKPNCEHDDTIPDKGFRIAEKSMKGRDLSHGTRFSAGSLIPKPARVGVKNKHSVGEFIFIYRSRSALQGKLILPASPSPSPAADKFNDMTEQELRQFARGMLRCKQENVPLGRKAAIKRDYDDQDDDAKRARDYKMVKLGSGKDAVDLTSD